MTVLEQLQTILPELSKTERKVAEYMLRFPHDVRRFSADVIAQQSGTSRSAVIRLCKKIGFTGYSELRYTLLSQKRMLSSPSEDINATLSVLDHYEACIRQLREMIDLTQIGAIADLLLCANRVVTLGMCHSMLAARQMAFRLNRNQIDCHAIDDQSIMEYYGSILRQGDVVLIFSISARDGYRELVRTYRKNRTVTVLFTMTPYVPLAVETDYTIVLPFVSHFASAHLMDDAISFFLAIEMVIEAIHRKQSDTEAQ